MNKKVSHKSKRRLIFFVPISLFLIAFFTYSLIGYINKVNTLNNEKAKLTDNISEIIEIQKSLKTEIEKLKDPEYIIRYANENYYFTTSKGEIVFKFQKTTTDNDSYQEVEHVTKYLWPIIIIGLVLSIIIIIKAIRRKKKDLI